MDLPSTLKQLDETVMPLYFMSEYDSPAVSKALKTARQTLLQGAFKKETKQNIADHLSSNEFSELIMKMRLWFNECGIFKSDQVWKNAHNLLALVCSSTDCSLTFGRKMILSGYLKFVIADVQHAPYVQLVQSQDARMCTAMILNLGTMYNTAKVDDLKEKFLELKVVEAIKPLTHASHDSIKILATVLMAEFLTEAEADRMATTDDVVSNLVSWLKSTLNNGRRTSVFNQIEIIHSLGRLAANDGNKKKIMATKPMAAFMKMILDDKCKDEQVMTIKTISNLAFDAEVRAELKAHAELMSALHRLAEGADEQLARAASSALWVINERSQEKVQEDKQTGQHEGHIMISYNWADQKTLLQVRDKLKTCGYKVWMDVDELSGSTLQGMADAVEGATVVLMCMSEKYKSSPNCRIEAEYAYQRQKLVLPLMTQRGYKPDGWLGLMMGSKLFVDFSGKYPFDQSWLKLQQQLQHALDERSFKVSKGPTSTRASGDGPKFAEWKEEDVVTWLKDLDLGSYEEAFRKVDGRSLEELQMMLKASPDSYYTVLRQDFAVHAVDLLRFTRALRILS